MRKTQLRRIGPHWWVRWAVGHGKYGLQRTSSWYAFDTFDEALAHLRVGLAAWRS